ncbi:MAG TPA: DUF433 domain-containing protein [Chloroflexota bacterium]|nr:DUF433 domain-containing protein [Chloroflexota bacterium]
MARTAGRAATLIARYIEDNPHAAGLDEARLIVSGVPVWALVGHWRAIGEDIAQVAHDYDLPDEAVEAALAYYRQHAALIDARILANTL